MNHRERVLMALNHEEPDRVPIDLGATVVTSIATSTYKELRAYLGLCDKEPEIAEITQQIAVVDQDVLEALDADIIPVWANPPSNYALNIVDDGENGSYFIDEFGAKLVKPMDGFYYDWREFPLSEPSLEALNSMPWPNVEDPTRYEGLRLRALKLRSETDYALFGMAPCGHDLFNQLFRVRGMVEGMTDLLINEDFAEAFLDRMMTTIIHAQELFLDEVGDLIDIHFTADDLCGQCGPLISPSIYRRLIKPRWARIMETIRSKTKAKIFYHTCGAIREFIPDLVEMGVQVINPVQTSAEGMNTSDLKKEFGKTLSFWGGGCDTQHILPFCSPDDVRKEVRMRVKDLAPGGGFVFNPVHNIQPGVTPENIAAMFDAALKFGTY